MTSDKFKGIVLNIISNLAEDYYNSDEVDVAAGLMRAYIKISKIDSGAWPIEYDDNGEKICSFIRREEYK